MVRPPGCGTGETKWTGRGTAGPGAVAPEQPTRAHQFRGRRRLRRRRDTAAGASGSHAGPLTPVARQAPLHAQRPPVTGGSAIILARRPPVASGRTPLPAQHTSLPARHTSLPARHTSLPARHTSLPARHTSLPARHTSLPARPVLVVLLALGILEAGWSGNLPTRMWPIGVMPTRPACARCADRGRSFALDRGGYSVWHRGWPAGDRPAVPAGDHGARHRGRPPAGRRVRVADPLRHPGRDRPPPLLRRPAEAPGRPAAEYLRAAARGAPQRTADAYRLGTCPGAQPRHPAVPARPVAVPARHRVPLRLPGGRRFGIPVRLGHGRRGWAGRAR